MKELLYIHGGDAYSRREDFVAALATMPLREPFADPAEKWPQTLRRELGEGWRVMTPRMPNSQNARYDEWKVWFMRHLALTEQPPVLLGWSLGGMFLVKYLIEEAVAEPFPALLLLGAPFGMYDDPTGEDCGTFRFDSGRVGEIAGKAKEIHIFHSKDDQVVPFEHGEGYLAALPEAAPHFFTDKGHFVIAEFPEVLAVLRGL